MLILQNVHVFETFLLKIEFNLFQQMIPFRVYPTRNYLVSHVPYQLQFSHKHLASIRLNDFSNGLISDLLEPLQQKLGMSPKFYWGEFCNQVATLIEILQYLKCKRLIAELVDGGAVLDLGEGV